MPGSPPTNRVGTESTETGRPDDLWRLPTAESHVQPARAPAVHSGLPAKTVIWRGVFLKGKSRPCGIFKIFIPLFFSPGAGFLPSSAALNFPLISLFTYHSHTS